MALRQDERRQLERLRDRGFPINWAALERDFNLTCAPVITPGVSYGPFVDVAHTTTELISLSRKAISLSGIVFFPTICDPDIWKRPDRLTHKRSQNSYFVVGNIEINSWLRSRPRQQLALALDFYVIGICAIPDSHLPTPDKDCIIDALERAAETLA